MKLQSLGQINFFFFAADTNGMSRNSDLEREGVVTASVE